MWVCKATFIAISLIDSGMTFRPQLRLATMLSILAWVAGDLAARRRLLMQSNRLSPPASSSGGPPPFAGNVAARRRIFWEPNRLPPPLPLRVVGPPPAPSIIPRNPARDNAMASRPLPSLAWQPSAQQSALQATQNALSVTQAALQSCQRDSLRPRICPSQREFWRLNGQFGFKPTMPPPTPTRPPHCITPGCVESGGKWLDRKVVSEADIQGAYTAKSKVQKRVARQVKDIIFHDTQLSFGRSSAVDTLRRIFKLCMNTDVITQRQTKPLFELLSQTMPMPFLGQSVAQFKFSTVLATVAQTFALNPFWITAVDALPQDPSRFILTLDQPSLNQGALLVESPRSTAMLGAVAKASHAMLTLIAQDAGISAPDSQINAAAAQSIGLEKRLAAINWDVFFQYLLPPAVRQMYSNEAAQVMVNEPQYFVSLNSVLLSTAAETLANHLVITIAKRNAQYLDFRFLRILNDQLFAVTGQEDSRPRDSICLSAMEPMDEIVGAIYADKYFDEDSKQEADLMITNIVGAFHEVIGSLTWMDLATKQAAQFKLSTMKRQVGYPAYARNIAQLDERFADLAINANDGYFEAALKLKRREVNKAFLILLKPANKQEFSLSPSAVNAVYYRHRNEMQLPAAIIQPDSFRTDFPKAVNYGALGAIIGHELVHGFDNQGSQHDARGIQRNWWSASSADNFESRKQCLIRQYNSYRVEAANMTLRGEATIAENIADNGGIKIAFRAYQRLQAMRGDEQLLPGLNLTNEQIFFTSFGADWCALQKPDTTRMQILFDEHSVEEYRVIGPLSNSDDFARAFNCPVGSRMNPHKSDRTKCEVW